MKTTTQDHAVPDIATGLSALDAVLGPWRPGGLYWFCGDEAGCADALTGQIMLHNLRRCPIVLLDDMPPEPDGSALASRVFDAICKDWIRVLLSDEGNATTNISLQPLLSDIEQALEDRPGLLVWRNPAHLLGRVACPDHELICQLKGYLARRQHVCLMVTDGRAAPLPSLRQAGETFTGMAQIDRQRLYIVHWHRYSDTLAAHALAVDCDEKGIRCTALSAAEAGATLQRPLSQRVLATTGVLGGAAPPRDWRVHATPADLMQVPDLAEAGCLLLHRDSEMSQAMLENALKPLRDKVGRGIPIVIVERGLTIRHGEAERLTRLGATLIVPDVPLNTLIRTCDALKHLAIDHPGPPVALPPVPSTPHRGYLPPDAFVSRVRRLIADNARLGIQDVLLRLQPLPGIALADVVRACQPHRSDDLATADDSGFYLFVNACREEDVDTALSHIFVLPPDQLFEWDQRLVTDSDKQQALERLRRRAGRAVDFSHVTLPDGNEADGPLENKPDVRPEIVARARQAVPAPLRRTEE